MLLALISDVHGNLPALEAVLAQLEQEPVDELVCLGDVAVGPQPSETTARLRELGCPVVMGNWDAWFLDGFPILPGAAGAKFVEQGEWWAARLSDGDRAYMRTFLPTLELALDGTSALCFHGSPRSYDELILATTPHEDVLRALSGCEQPLQIGGHTHVQLVRVVEGMLVLNPGSVGLPFRGVETELQRVSPWAEYALVRIDDGRLSVDLRRARYDVGNLLEVTLESGVPYAEWWVETWDLAASEPPSRPNG
jgi:putative phosphoesterase